MVETKGSIKWKARTRHRKVKPQARRSAADMSKEVMGNLWEPLQTTKAKGMRLAIVKRIVDAHGGSVSVESRIGEGTTFTTGLPLKSKVVTKA